MAKIPLPCPSDITTPAMKKCWPGTGKSLQQAYTAQLFKEFECEGTCDLFVIVSVRELGPCPDDAAQKEFEVIANVGCVQLPQQRDFSILDMPKEEVIKAILVDLNVKQQEQKSC